MEHGSVEYSKSHSSTRLKRIIVLASAKLGEKHIQKKVTKKQVVW